MIWRYRPFGSSTWHSGHNVARRIFGLDIDNHRMLDVDEIVEAVAEQDVRYKRWRVPLGEQLLGPRGAKRGSVVMPAPSAISMRSLHIWSNCELGRW